MKEKKGLLPIRRASLFAIAVPVLPRDPVSHTHTSADIFEHEAPAITVALSTVALSTVAPTNSHTTPEWPPALNSNIPDAPILSPRTHFRIYL
jgi:hypothetical protein